MTMRGSRTLTLVGTVAWLVVAGYGVRSAVVEDDRGWELTYTVFSVALLVGVAGSVGIATLVTRQSGRPRLRLVGLVISGLGGVSAVVAWALPLWMTILGVGFAVLTVASGSHQRRAVALMAAGQLVGPAVMFVGIAAELGRRDEWGDYPAAGGIAVVVVALMTIIALFVLARGTKTRWREAMQGDSSLALGLSGTE